MAGPGSEPGPDHCRQSTAGCEGIVRDCSLLGPESIFGTLDEGVPFSVASVFLLLAEQDPTGRAARSAR